MTTLATGVTTDLDHGLDHSWVLRVEEFEEGRSVRAFECVGCGAVRFE